MTSSLTRKLIPLHIMWLSRNTRRQAHQWMIPQLYKRRKELMSPTRANAVDNTKQRSVAVFLVLNRLNADSSTQCNGNDPCDKCLQSNSQCTFTPRAEDKRFRGNRPTTTQLSDLHNHQQVLNYLWQAILDGKEQDILHRIRSGASIRDVADHLGGVFTIRSTETRDDASTSSITAPLHKEPDPAAYAVSIPVELSVNETFLDSNLSGTTPDTGMLQLSSSCAAQLRFAHTLYVDLN